MQMVSLYKDPTGKDVFSNITPNYNHASIQSAQQLQNMVQQLEKQKQLSEVC